MPLRDAVVRLLENGRIDPSQHALILHPSDLNQLATFFNGPLLDQAIATGHPPLPTMFGLQVFTSTHVPSGEVFLFRRQFSLFEGPTRAWIDVAADARARTLIRPGAGGAGSDGRVILESYGEARSFWELLSESDE